MMKIHILSYEREALKRIITKKGKVVQSVQSFMQKHDYENIMRAMSYYKIDDKIVDKINTLKIIGEELHKTLDNIYWNVIESKEQLKSSNAYNIRHFYFNQWIKGNKNPKAFDLGGTFAHSNPKKYPKEIAPTTMNALYDHDIFNLDFKEQQQLYDMDMIKVYDGMVRTENLGTINLFIDRNIGDMITPVNVIEKIPKMLIQKYSEIYEPENNGMKDIESNEPKLKNTENENEILRIISVFSRKYPEEYSRQFVFTKYQDIIQQHFLARMLYYDEWIKSTSKGIPNISKKYEEYKEEARNEKRGVLRGIQRVKDEFISEFQRYITRRYDANIKVTQKLYVDLLYKLKDTLMKKNVYTRQLFCHSLTMIANEKINYGGIYLDPMRKGYCKVK